MNTTVKTWTLVSTMVNTLDQRDGDRISLGTLSEGTYNLKDEVYGYGENGRRLDVDRTIKTLYLDYWRQKERWVLPSDKGVRQGHDKLLKKTRWEIYRVEALPLSRC